MEVHPDDREVMSVQLKDTITKAFEQNRTWSIDWTAMRLPVIAKRRRQQQREEELIRKRDLEQMQGDLSARIRNGVAVASGSGSGARMAMPATPVMDERLEKRLKRFERTPPARIATPVVSSSEHVVGRATNLEKRYLRLTSAPDPELVRPLHILRQTLDLLKEKWRQDQNYPYICDQFKSLRQDLTVQHIENEFTVSVYEIHARIALEKSDLGEYNQCQSRLKELYSKGIEGQETEFVAYRILYLLHTQSRSEIGHLLTNLLKDATMNDPGIAHALLVDKAMSRKNYHQLFRLYADAPKMGGYVMDSFIGRERLSALSTVCCAYKPDISVEFLTKELGFASTAECFTFLNDNELVQYVNDKNKLVTKDAYVPVELARQKAFKKVDIKGQI